jgi:hypothetical protein
MHAQGVDAPGRAVTRSGRPAPIPPQQSPHGTVKGQSLPLQIRYAFRQTPALDDGQGRVPAFAGKGNALGIRRLGQQLRYAAFDADKLPFGLPARPFLEDGVHDNGRAFRRNAGSLHSPYAIGFRRHRLSPQKPADADADTYAGHHNKTGNDGHARDYVVKHRLLPVF